MRRNQLAQKIGALCLSAFLFACQKGGTGLATDKIESETCPASGCASLTAEQSQLSVKGPAQTTIYSNVLLDANSNPQDFVEVGGSCFASTYPDNRLEVKLFNTSGGQIALAASDIVSVKTTNTGLPKCVAGKYGITINGARMPAGSTGTGYRLHVEIVGIDSTGAETRNSGTGYFDVSVSRLPPL